MIIITLVKLELNSNVTNVIAIYIFKCERTLATLEQTQMLLTFSHTLSTSNSFEGPTFTRVKNPKVILVLFSDLNLWQGSLWIPDSREGRSIERIRGRRNFRHRRRHRLRRRTTTGSGVANRRQSDGPGRHHHCNFQIICR